MTVQKYRAVIVGLTGIGARRPAEAPNLPLYGRMPRSHAAAYYRHPQTEVVGVCDIRQEALEAFEASWHDVWPGVHTYVDYREMFEEERPDLVSVATSDHLHADITVDAAKCGARAVLCEKPIATTLADADRMIAAAEANDVLLSIEHTRRWDPRYQKARELVRSGEFGSLRTIVNNMFTPRAMLFRNGTHMIDTICFFAEADPSWVFAELEEGFDHYAEYSGDGGHDPSSEPAASSYIHFSNGVRAFFNSAKTAGRGSDFELVCQEGSVLVSDRELRVMGTTPHGGAWSAPILPDNYAAEFQLASVAELVHVLEHGGKLVSSAREARKSLEIILAMLKSHRLSNARVNLPLS